MAPRWLHFGDDTGNKRASVLSIVSNSRRTTFEDPDALVSAFSHPFFDQNSIHDALDNADHFSIAERPVSRKRYSLFARSAVPSESEADRHTPLNSRAWPRLFQDKLSAKDPGSSNGAEMAWKHSRKSVIARTGSRHEPILRWMRRVERSSSSRPPTPYGVRYEPDVEVDDFEHQQKKATISAPYNFQHVTHTQPRELPQLNFVSDQELSLSFWAASAHQTPQSDLRGIRAEDIEEAQKSSRPESALESRPISADRNSTFSRALSPSPREGASPVLRATRSLSNASAHSRDDSRRPSVISRSASLASLIAEQRGPPTMVHPAFRNTSEPTQVLPTMPSMPWLSPSGMQTPTSEMNRNLDVVPEESEGQSPVKQAESQKPALLSAVDRLIEESEFSGELQCSASSFCSEGQETNTTSHYDMSVPSLSSGETWEEDIDFCYNMEAEATCDFQWRHGKNPCASPHDSVFASSRKFPTDAGSPYDMSPRMSLGRYPSSKASTNVTPMLSSQDFATRWDAGAFENPRAAPGAPAPSDSPLPEINRLSSLLDLPMLQTDSLQTETRRSADGVSPRTPWMLTGAKNVLDRSLSSSTRGSSERKYFVLPSPPPTSPLPPLPTAGSMLTKRATIGGRAEMSVLNDQEAPDTQMLPITTRGIQSLKSALPMRLRASRSVEGPALRDKMSRSRSSPSVNALYEAHAIPKTAEKFPVWI
ncbi:hypothetical protein ANO11243_021730 [Dothideomycetidae sp. 11243]|nr:hypothetical protein ANO11243_021730 [fungal sp. No.11243]